MFNRFEKKYRRVTDRQTYILDSIAGVMHGITWYKNVASLYNAKMLLSLIVRRRTTANSHVDWSDLAI